MAGKLYIMPAPHNSMVKLVELLYKSFMRVLEGWQMEQSGYSATNIYNFLKDIDFPVTKQEIITYAEEHDVSEVILDRLEQLPDRLYESMADLMKEAVM